MTEAMRLFDPGAAVPVAPVEADERLSAGRRLTLRNARLIGRGVHPSTRLPLADPGETCGSCDHAYRVEGSTRVKAGKAVARGYWKCGLVPATHGGATDLRVSWPACVSWVSGAAAVRVLAESELAALAGQATR